MAQTEDVIQALLDTLVDHLLPSRVLKFPLSKSAQESVAKQMHAVVLLYNYYHRKQNPEQRFLGFQDFSKLALVLKPNLSSFMRMMMKNRQTVFQGSNDQLSISEKAIKNACDIAAALDASTEFSSRKGWPISKLTVLLTDSQCENCYVQADVITEGGWSFIEKQVDENSVIMDISMEGKHREKRTRSCKNTSNDYSKFLDLAFDAVKQVTGVENDLQVLGTHVTYSTSKEKSAVLCYVMQLPGSSCIGEQVPLKLVHECLQSPLTENLDWGTCKTASNVKHHRLLPYIDIISGLLSQKSLRSPGLCSSNRMAELKYSRRGSTGNMATGVYPKFNSSELYRVSAEELNQQVKQVGSSTRSIEEERNESSSEQLQNALALLCCKRQATHSELCKLEDLLAVYEDCIERIRDDGEIGLARKCINAIINGNDHLLPELSAEVKELNNKETHDSIPQKQSEHYFPGKSSCEDLVHICRMNNWKLPRYFVESREGKFRSEVYVRGKYMEVCCEGSWESKPCEARESAAAKLIAEIKSCS